MEPTDDALAEAARAATAAARDARLQELAEALVRHLLAFAREVRLTPEEGRAAIRLLAGGTAAAEGTASPISLLADVLGLPGLADLIRDAAGADGALPGLLAAFFRDDVPVLPTGTSIATSSSGEPILLHGRVLDASGAPVAGAVLDIWQTGEDGLYGAEPTVDGALPADMRGRFRTDEDGCYLARTVLPRRAIGLDEPGRRGGPARSRPAFHPVHLHLLVAAPGYRGSLTALYIADGEPPDGDAVFGAGDSLLVAPGPPDASLPFTSLRQIAVDLHVRAPDPTRAAEDAVSFEASK